MAETRRQGEFRSLTPQEIGRAVVTFRQVLGMKQVALAVDAGIDERTVQRIERGEKVNDETLRRVARILGMKEDSFIGPRYVPTLEEAADRVARTFSEMIVVESHDFTSLHDCEAVLGKDGYIVNDEHVKPDAAHQVAEFRDLLTDCGDIFDEVSYADRLAACRLVQDAVRRIEAKGYRTQYCVYTTDDCFRVSVVMFLPKSDERLNKLRQFLLPRSFDKLIGEPSRTHCIHQVPEQLENRGR